jgi:hypothetical protein
MIKLELSKSKLEQFNKTGKFEFTEAENLLLNLHAGLKEEHLTERERKILEQYREEK